MGLRVHQSDIADALTLEAFNMLPLQLSTAGFLAFTWLFSIAAAQSSTVSFAYPAEPTGTTPMLIMNVVDTVVVQWKSNFKKAWLRLYCDVGTAGKPQVYQCKSYRIAKPFMHTNAKIQGPSNLYRPTETQPTRHFLIAMSIENGTGRTSVTSTSSTKTRKEKA